MQNLNQNRNKHHRGSAVMLRVLQIFFSLVLIAGVVSGFYLLHKHQVFNRESNQITNQNSQVPLSVNNSGSPQPVRLEIASINLVAPIVPVSVDSQNALQIPDQENTVGWYSGGPMPGQRGSSVIDGHLDTATTPAIFWKLNKVKTGDTVKVDFSDGSQKNFTVYATKNFPQNQFPSQQVYGDPGFAGLNLITCSGTYVHSISRYTDNLVVFSKLN